MLNRVAVHLWRESASLPAAVNDEGALLHITNKCRDKLDDALRPWTVAERKAQDADIAAQWSAMFGDPDNNSNAIAQALRKQQMIIAGLMEPEPEN